MNKNKEKKQFKTIIKHAVTIGKMHDVYDISETWLLLYSRLQATILWIQVHSRVNMKNAWYMILMHMINAWYMILIQHDKMNDIWF